MGAVSISRLFLSFSYLSVEKKTSNLLSVIAPFTGRVFPV